jgi:hypothetical protein
MSFLAPFTLIALALLALPVLIHLLVRRRARRLDFPSLRFLRETPSFRLYPRHIKEPLLLALRVLALALLVLALARPFISFKGGSRLTRVILLDASLSMRTRGRTEAAREQARAILNKLNAGERATILAFSTGASVLAEPTADRDRLIEALQRFEPTSGAADFGAGLRAANALLQQEAAPGAAEIDLISDFQESNLAASTADLSSLPITDARVVSFAVGTQIERNAFLTDETLVRDERGLELSATEMLSEPEGQTASRRHWTLGAVGEGGSAADLEWRSAVNGQITGALKANAPDDFDEDDNYFFAFAPPRESRALLIETDTGGASIYLRAALEAATAEEEEAAQPARLALDRRRELPASAAELNSYSLVVVTLHGAPRAGEVRVLSEYAKAGGTVWLCAGRDLEAEAWSALASTPEGSDLPFISLSRVGVNRPFSFGAIDMDAPALRSLGEGALSALRATRISAGYVITPRESAAVMMRWSDQTPAAVAAEVGAGSMLLLATSPEREAGELGLSPSLPALAYSIMRASVTSRRALSKFIGEPVQLGVDPGTDVTITDREARTTHALARTLAQQPQSIFREPGVYRLEFAGQTQMLAFNAPVEERARTLATPDLIKSYFAAKESDATRAASGARDWTETAERRLGLWRFFLGAAFMLLVAELFVSMRRRPRGELLSDGPNS